MAVKGERLNRGTMNVLPSAAAAQNFTVCHSAQLRSRWEDQRERACNTNPQTDVQGTNKLTFPGNPQLKIPCKYRVSWEVHCVLREGLSATAVCQGTPPLPSPVPADCREPCFGFPALWEVIQPANCGQVLPLFVLSRCTVGKALCGLSPLTLSSTAPKQHCSRLNPTPHPSAHHSTDGISSLAANPFPVVEFLFSQSTSEKGEPPLLRSGQVSPVAHSSHTGRWIPNKSSNKPCSKTLTLLWTKRPGTLPKLSLADRPR